MKALFEPQINTDQRRSNPKELSAFICVYRRLTWFLAAGLFPTIALWSGPIQFEDATAKSGIQFTHSIGAEKLGSLLESTGSGCAWLDYNNDGKPDLFVVGGRPLEPGMHPYPLRKPPAAMPHNHLYRNDGS